MTDAQTLLPENATPLERAISIANARLLDVPVHVIRDVKSGLRTPLHLLGYLAWEESVDVWDEAWPDELKRYVVERAMRDHQLKGTRALHERYLGYLGIPILRAITPPSRLVMGRARTEAEREAELAGMPEIRIYPLAPRRPAGQRLFWGRGYRNNATGWSASHAADVNETRAVLIREGVTTRLRIADTRDDSDPTLGTFSRTYIPHRWGGSRVLGPGHGRRQRAWGRGTATEFVVSHRTTSTAAGRQTVSRSRVPADVAPIHVAEPHAVSRRKAFLSHRCTTRRFYSGSVATEHVYDRLRLWDGTPGTTRRRRSFWGWSWRNVPTHEAVLSIDVGRPAPARKRWWGWAYAGAMRPHDGTRLRQALGAVRAAALPHETILIDLETAFEQRFYGAA